MSILKLGNLLLERRGDEGIREFAKKLGISPATLSRIENGKLPDLETFSKICDKLGLDPSDILQVGKKASGHAPAAAVTLAAHVHFKADPQQTPSAARDLAKLILAAQKHAATME
jgi:transcriptional regulator with XRE-family HTH domain